MPKSKMNYSDMIIYKICCNDLSIKDIYIGHTCNLAKRRWHHKNCCNNENGKYNMKVYQFIRENGGWDNWSVILVDKCPCLDLEEATKIERHYIEILNATLNMVIPSRTTKEYYYANKEKRLENHKKWVNENPDKVKQYTIEYREKNKERILEKDRESSKLYREKNKELVVEQRKRYEEKNKEIILEKANKYYYANKEKILETHKEKTTCECGCIVSNASLTRHRKSQKHLKLIEQLIIL